MTREELLKLWAPEGGTWSLWVRPIPFAQMPEPITLAQQTALANRSTATSIDPNLRDLLTLKTSSAGTVVVLDLPGEESTWSGLALVQSGYCPVPLFNACTGPNELVPQGPIVEALKSGGAALVAETTKNGPPVFLLDSRRMGPPGVVPKTGDFDNRWQVFAQDFPSAAYLTERGYGRALLIQRGSRQPHEDLAHVLLRWQEGGLAIEAKDLADREPPVPINIARPKRYRSAWHRLLAMLSLSPNPSGGFGGEKSEPRHG